MTKKTLRKNRIANLFEIKKMSIKKNRVASYFKTKKEIESLNEEISKISFLY